MLRRWQGVAELVGSDLTQTFDTAQAKGAFAHKAAVLQMYQLGGKLTFAAGANLPGYLTESGHSDDDESPIFSTPSQVGSGAKPDMHIS